MGSFKVWSGGVGGERMRILTTVVYPLHTPLYYANQPFGNFRYRRELDRLPPGEMKSFLALKSLMKGVRNSCAYCTEYCL